MTEYLITAFTVLFAENALFASFYGADELDRLTGDGKKMRFSALLFIVSNLITEVFVAIVGCYILPNPRDSFIIIIPTVSFFVMCGVVLAVGRIMPDKYDVAKALSPIFALNTASAGVIYESAVGAESIADAVIAAGISSVAVILSFALFISIKERIISSKLPSPLRGIPILLISAGLIAMILTGFGSMRF